MWKNKKGEALPRDKTLWIASHRDSIISLVNRIGLSRGVKESYEYLWGRCPMWDSFAFHGASLTFDSA
jgi:hypothetical protein